MRDFKGLVGEGGGIYARATLLSLREKAGRGGWRSGPPTRSRHASKGWRRSLSSSLGPGMTKKEGRGKFTFFPQKGVAVEKGGAGGKKQTVP